MRRIKRAVLLAVTLFAFSFASSGQVNLAISGIGLNDYISNSPQALTLDLTNLSPQPAEYRLEIQTRMKWGNDERVAGRYTSSTQLAANESKQLDFPISLPQYSTASVRVLVFDKAGQQIARKEIKTSEFKSSNTLIAALCDDKLPQCTAVWSSILSNSNEEQSDRKQKRFNFVAPRLMGAHFWNYSPAKYVVLARPVAGLTDSARNGLEEYVRMGGILIWSNREAGPTDWLADYREVGAVRRVANGFIYTIPSIDSPLLSQLFTKQTTDGANSPFRQVFPGYDGYGPMTFESRNSTHFNFPSLRWLLLWLFVYIVVVGAVNFTILRKMRRLELGWVTIPAISVLFAAILFFTSSSQRPRTMVLDQPAVYIMDPLSPMASARYSLRVSSPRAADVVIQAPSEAVWNLGTNSGLTNAKYFWSQMFGRGGSDDDAFQLRFGTRNEHPVSLLRWSFEDIALSGVRTFKGSVVRASPNKLRNETGVDFREAIYVDPKLERVYTLGSVPSGREIDLDTAQYQGRQGAVNSERERWVRGRLGSWSQNSDVPFRLTELLMYAPHEAAFYGLADGPALGATLKDLDPVQHNTALFIVGMQ